MKIFTLLLIAIFSIKVYSAPLDQDLNNDNLKGINDLIEANLDVNDPTDRETIIDTQIQANEEIKSGSINLKFEALDLKIKITECSQTGGTYNTQTSTCDTPQSTCESSGGTWDGASCTQALSIYFYNDNEDIVPLLPAGSLSSSDFTNGKMNTRRVFTSNVNTNSQLIVSFDAIKWNGTECVVFYYNNLDAYFQDHFQGWINNEGTSFASMPDEGSCQDSAAVMFGLTDRNDVTTSNGFIVPAQ